MNRRKIKITILSCLFLVGILAFVIPADSQYQISREGAEESLCTLSNSSFTVGETLVYRLYYNLNFIWIPAGEVTFKVEDAGDQFHISAEGRTLKSYDWIFKVRDYYDVYVDKETLLPTKATRKVAEGGYSLYDEVEFDRERNMATSLRGKTQDVATLQEYPISNCIHDILSVIYYTRNLEFENYGKGEKFPVDIFMDKEEWNLRVTHGGNIEEKKVKGLGKYNTILFHPEVISGDIFEEGTNMNVFVSNDDNRIPLLIESPISVGSVKAVLRNTEGLRHEFSSKVP